jgi:hypothetical protein
VRPLAVLVVLAATLPAQVPAVDVHVLELRTEAGTIVPVARIVASQRLRSSGPESERMVSVRLGGMKVGARFVANEGGVLLQRHVGRSSFRESPGGRTLDVTEPYRWGRRLRHGTHVRGALLCEEVADESAPFVPVDVTQFLRRIVDLFLQQDVAPALVGRIQSIAGEHPMFEWGTPRWKAALVLGSLPLDDYLTEEQAERILEKRPEDPSGLDDMAWTFLRPLIVLGDEPTLHALIRRAENGRDDRDEGGVLTPRVPRSVEDSVLVAYATAPDRQIRGLAGWAATGTRIPELFDMLAADLREGKAVLPETDAGPEQMERHIVDVQAWQSVGSPLLLLAASALAIGVVLMALRMAVRRMF